MLCNYYSHTLELLLRQKRCQRWKTFLIWLNQSWKVFRLNPLYYWLRSDRNTQFDTICLNDQHLKLIWSRYRHKQMLCLLKIQWKWEYTRDIRIIIADHRYSEISPEPTTIPRRLRRTRKCSDCLSVCLCASWNDWMN